MSTKPGSGRKKISDVWNYFAYDSVTDKSTCNVCKCALKGENTSNLNTHLKTHATEYTAFKENDDRRKKLSAKSTSNLTTNTISQVLAKPTRSITWPVDSFEHSNRQQALMKMFSTTGLPNRLVDNTEFRKFCASLDPKFALPRE